MKSFPTSTKYKTWKQGTQQGDVTLHKRKITEQLAINVWHFFLKNYKPVSIRMHFNVHDTIS